MTTGRRKRGVVRAPRRNDTPGHGLLVPPGLGAGHARRSRPLRAGRHRGRARDRAAADRGRVAIQRLGRGATARRQLRVRARATGRLPPGPARAPRAGTGRGRRPRAGPRRLGPGFDDVGRAVERAPGRTAPPPDGARRHTVRPHAARRRDAGADGARARLPAPPDRLARSRAARRRSARLGRVRAPGVGTVPPRQGQPQLVDDRARPDGRARRVARRGRRPRARTVGRLLRRLDRPVLRQLAAPRDAFDGACPHLSLGRDHRRAFRRRLQHRARAGRHDHRPELGRTAVAARRDLSRRRRDRERQPDHRLDAPWSSAAARAGATRFTRFALHPATQAKVAAAGFRPVRGTVDRALLNPAEGVDLHAGTDSVAPAAPAAIARALSTVAGDRRPGRVLVLFDVSDSMGDAGEHRAEQPDEARARPYRAHRRARAARARRRDRPAHLHHEAPEPGQSRLARRRPDRPARDPASRTAGGDRRTHAAAGFAAVRGDARRVRHRRAARRPAPHRRRRRADRRVQRGRPRQHPRRVARAPRRRTGRPRFTIGYSGQADSRRCARSRRRRTRGTTTCR